MFDILATHLLPCGICSWCNCNSAKFCLVTGIIRYVGHVDFAEGLWLGVALKTAKGKHDGCVQGRRYFTCKPGHGLLVRPSRVSVRGINGSKLRVEWCKYCFVSVLAFLWQLISSTTRFLFQFSFALPNFCCSSSCKWSGDLNLTVQLGMFLSAV